MDQLAPHFRHYAHFWLKYVRNRRKNRIFEINYSLKREWLFISKSRWKIQNQSRRRDRQRKETFERGKNRTIGNPGKSVKSENAAAIMKQNRRSKRWGGTQCKRDACCSGLRWSLQPTDVPSHRILGERLIITTWFKTKITQPTPPPHAKKSPLKD